jgi:hypothetical protein
MKPVLKRSPSKLLVALTGLTLFIGLPCSATTKSLSKSSGDGSRIAKCSYGIAQDGSNNCMSKAEYDITTSRQAALDADPAQYMRNALVRCEGLKIDRDDCIARIRGGGTVSGSVEAGGLYRELVTIIPGKPAAPVPKEGIAVEPK